jgi:spore germination protein KB
MESSEKISGSQLCLLIFSFIAPTVILIMPEVLSKISKQDAWITIFPAVLIGSLTMWAMIILSNRYPGLTIIQYSSQIIGKWPAKCLGCYFIYYWFNFDFIALNQHIQFVNTVLFMTTPAIIISLTLALLCGLAAYMGIESIARSSQFISILILTLLIPLLILMLAESDPERLRPVMSQGIVPVLQGTLFPFAYLGQIIILGWLLPYLNQPKKATKVSFIALLLIAGLLYITVIPLIMIFGPLVEKLSFPVLDVVRYVGIKGIFERLEALGVVIWVMGTFIKVSLIFFLICLSVSHLFNIRNYKDFVFPLTILSVIGSVSVFNKYSTEMTTYLTYSFPSYAFFTQAILPLTLLMIDTIKRRWRKSEI